MVYGLLLSMHVKQGNNSHFHSIFIYNISNSTVEREHYSSGGFRFCCVGGGTNNLKGAPRIAREHKIYKFSKLIVIR